jgi:hypothetical protein
MSTQVFRILFIAFFAILAQSLFNVSNVLSLSKQIQYPLIIALTPYLISKLPLLGTKNLMSTGVQPLLSLVFMTICTVVIQYIMKEIKSSSQVDFLSKYIKDEEPLRIGDIKIEKDFVVILSFVLLSELIFQSVGQQNKYTKLEDAMLRALKKFHGKK